MEARAHGDEFDVGQAGLVIVERDRPPRRKRASPANLFVRVGRIALGLKRGGGNGRKDEQMEDAHRGCLEPSKVK